MRTAVINNQPPSAEAMAWCRWNTAEQVRQRAVGMGWADRIAAERLARTIEGAA